MKLVSEILKLEDSFQSERIDKFLTFELMASSLGSLKSTFLEVVLRYKDIHTMFTILILIWWSDMMALSHIHEIAIKHAPKFKWMVQFINSMTYRHLPHSIVMDHEGRIRNVSEELRRSISKFDIEISSESDESSVEINCESDCINNNIQPIDESDKETRPEEHKDEDSTSSDEEFEYFDGYNR